MKTLRERFEERNTEYEAKLAARRAELTPKTPDTPLELLKARFPHVVRLEIKRDPHSTVQDLIAVNRTASAIRDEMAAWIKETSVCESSSYFSIESDENTGGIAAYLYGGFESPADAFSYKMRWM